MSFPGPWFPSEGLMPHGFCYQWRTSLIVLHAVSDSLIAGAYFLIPAVLLHLTKRKRNIPFKRFLMCFAVFIAACSSTHILDVVTLWVPAYWLSGLAKAFTALVSLVTAALLVWFSPKILHLPTIDEMQAANEELRRQSEALRFSENMFRQMADNIGEIFWLLDPKTLRVVYVSPAFEEICQRPISSLFSDPISYRALLHPDDADKVLESLSRLRETNCLDEELRIICPDESVQWLHVTGFTVTDHQGKVNALVGTARDITLRKEMDEVLRKNEDRYRDLVEHSHDLICTHDLGGRLLSMNQLPATILGYSRDEILNTPMRQFMPLEAWPSFDEYIARIQTDGFASGLLPVVTKSGEIRIWEYYNTLRTEGVTAPVIRGIAHDVTEQKRAEKALQQSEEKFSKAFKSSPNIMSISTLVEGRFVEVNEAFERYSGLARSEAIGRTVFELGLWEDASGREALVKAIQENGRVQNWEARFRSKSGHQTLVLLSIEVIELAGEQCLLAVGQDISAQKEAEDALRKSEADYRSLFLGAPCGIFQVARDGTFMLVNNALVEMLGYESAEELLTKNLATDIYEIPADRLQALRSLEQGQDSLKGVEVRWKRKNGTPILVRANARTVRGESGALLYCETIVEDITSQRSLEEQIKQVQKMEALALMSGGIAHDFNNILTGVLGLGELVLKSFEEGDPRKARIESIVHTAIRGRSLTGQLLAFSRDEALPIYKLNLDAEIEQTQDVLRRLIGEHVQIRLLLGARHEKILAERGAILQVIFNLTANARDAMPRGGCVTLWTSAVQVKPDQTDHMGVPPGEYVLLELADTGCGMDKATLNRIFEPFFTTKAVRKGTGLGLYTVYGIVRQCSGLIRVVSEVGRGSTFRIYFPIAEVVAPASPRPSNGHTTAGSKPRVLVVEDDETTREVLQCQLEDCGCVVRCEASPTAAIDHYKNSGDEFKLLVTDVILPDLTGPDLAKHLRHNQPDLKVLYISGWAPADILPADALGVDVELLRKPFTAQELSSTIHHLLR